MAITKDTQKTWGGKTEHFWEGTAAQDVDSTDGTPTKITAVQSHLAIVQITLSLVASNETTTFTAKINHDSSVISGTFYSQDMTGEDTAFIRFNDDAGAIIPKGSAVDFDMTVSTDSWTLMVVTKEA